MVHLTFAHLFGMCVCQDCPDRNCTSDPCQEMFGSSAKQKVAYLDE